MPIRFDPITGDFSVTLGGGNIASNSFTTIQTDAGTYPTAGSSADTLTFTSANKTQLITGSSGGKSVTIDEAIIYAVGNSGSTCTINWNNGPIQAVTVNASCTFTFSNPVAGRSYHLIVTYSGTRTITWPTIKWPGGTAPTTSADTKKDIFGWDYDGTDYLGYSSVNY